jgi:glutamyl-tRNA reductase
MKLAIAGVTHQTAAVELRERLAVPAGAVQETLRSLKRNRGVAEAMVLSTCNRVEFTIVADDDVDPYAAIGSYFAERGFALDSIAGQMFRCEQRAAIEHLFRVASSLSSMIVGEPQILGQLKAAYQASKQEGASGGGLLDLVMSHAFHVAKRVRTETGIGQMAVSVSYAAVELARKIFGSLAGRKVMIVGSGKMSQLAARHLRRSGASHIYVTNRTTAHAQDLADLFGGTPVDYERFPSMLPEVDIVIASIAATDYIIDAETMQRVIGARRNRPIFLIDIGVPRNLDPAINKVDNVFLYDIDDLQGVVNSNLREREREGARAEEIVQQEVDATLARLRAKDIAPTILSLQEQLEEIRLSELNRSLRKLTALTPEQRETIDLMTRSIVNKIAHGPVSELRRQAGQPDGGPMVDAIRRVFRLRESAPK